ncbi:MAG TPA: hypothetical protein PKW08_12270 [Flavobacteriaceae bacterium]|nr:hypothetical protein [Flavobacteriaceae bacterium]MCB9211900.1 hypothetical protein [Alteromonas sp.]HPF10006.1 hypothetical protein [Flavobacteriaceae bacterium]HQU22354.1 hypothetical protein [Flavobacteriaceae bacterium]HQU63911.1 hypothetical protein [Flavobacteriaceae bacterium]
MKKETLEFLIKWLAFSVILFGVHIYVFRNFAEGITLYLPLWGVYLFNSTVALLVFFLVRRQFYKNPGKTYQSFLMLTVLKMVLAIIFLLPLFTGKSEHPKTETINFFIPYFLFLAFEIFSLNKFFQNAQTK